MAAAPVLFLAGVVFTYFVVLPPAVHFLQGYNADKFDVLVQAKPLVHVRDPHDARRSASRSSCPSGCSGSTGSA